jgi:hypothetical protein
MTTVINEPQQHLMIVSKSSPRVTGGESTNFHFFEQEVIIQSSSQLSSYGGSTKLIHRHAMVTRWGHFKRRGRNKNPDLINGKRSFILGSDSLTNPTFDEDISTHPHQRSIRVVMDAFRLLQKSAGFAKLINSIHVGDNRQWEEQRLGCYGVELKWTHEKFQNPSRDEIAVSSKVFLLGNIKGQIAIDGEQGWTQDPSVVLQMLKTNADQIQTYLDMQRDRKNIRPFLDKLPKPLIHPLIAAYRGQYHLVPFKAEFEKPKPEKFPTSDFASEVKKIDQLKKLSKSAQKLK